MREKEAGLVCKGWFEKPDERLLHFACRLLSGGAVPQTPGQGGVHEQFPLNNPPMVTVLLSTGKLLRSRLGVVLTLWAAYLVR